MFTAGMLLRAGARFEHLRHVGLVTFAAGSSDRRHERLQTRAHPGLLNPWKHAKNDRLPHRAVAARARQRRRLRPRHRRSRGRKFFWLPEAHTDFIFADHRRGTRLRRHMLAIVVLFVAFAYRAFAHRATHHRPLRLLSGVWAALMIVIQAFISIGVVTSSWPVTGVPLPFISFGGTSLIVSWSRSR
jgi:cell division protein FtsW